MPEEATELLLELACEDDCELWLELSELESDEDDKVALVGSVEDDKAVEIDPAVAD